MNKHDELVAKIKGWAVENNYPTFTIPDNCPNDGWEGDCYADGAYCMGGEFFRYEDMNDDLIETILEEAIIDD